MKDLTGAVLGRYKMIERIGRGGMSMVYRAAVTSGGGADVAVKVMDSSAETLDVFLQRFDQEAKIVEKMSHPNILPLLDYGHDKEYPYMVMPLMTGGTLADILRKNPLSQNDTGGWLYQIALALDHAHSRGVVHRDLKPTNILLDDSGHAYLTDFGIARLLNLTSSLTMTGNVVGTPTYMAPEQWRGEKASPLTDIYGLGVLVYLMLTGQPPFKADTPHSLMYKHLNEPPPLMKIFVENIRDEIDGVIRKALAKDPNERYRTAGDFSQDYQRALHGLETLAKRAPASSPKKTTGGFTAQIDAFRTPASLSAPSPPNDSYQSIPAPYNPNVLQPMVVYTPPKRRPLFSLRSCLLSLIIAASLIGFAYEINRNPDDYLPASVDIRVNDRELPPTPTPNASDVATIRIDSPADNSRYGIGSNVRVQLAAFDTQGVTKIEVRRLGYLLDVIENSSNLQPFRATFDYQPAFAGTHVLEFIPFRGNNPGAAAFLQIDVQ